MSLGTYSTSTKQIDCLVQDCSNSSALAMNLLLFRTKPSRYENTFTYLKNEISFLLWTYGSED